MLGWLRTFLEAKKTRTATLLSVFMGLALVGALSIQLMLLGEAYQNQEADFDHEVAIALRQMAQALERIDNNQVWRGGALPSRYESRSSTYLLDADDLLPFVNANGETLTVAEGYERLEEFPNVQIRPMQNGQYFVQVQELTTIDAHANDSAINALMWRNFRWMLPLEERFDMVLLDSVIRAELRLRGIKAPFKFAIAENGLLTNLISENYLPEPEDFKISLFSNNLFSGSTYLLLHFPSKLNYLNKQMWLIWFLILFFLTGIVLIFGYTLRQMQKQKQLAMMKSDFINNMTHEFKTPLATINLAVDALNNPMVRNDLEKMAHYTRIIKQENKRMNNQVEQVLRMAMLDKNELEIQQKRINVSELVEEAVAHFALLIEERGGVISSIAPDHPLFVIGDPVHLLSVFTNILDNANKYSPETPDIRVRVFSAGNLVCISIRDKGMGMTKDVQKQVFDRFFRAAGGDVHNVKGHGLGLSYVREIVQAHGGEVLVSSEPDKGSTFTVQLPQFFEVATS
jgi:two-component system phosphate regulon sensor histidine kinase PhoR